jgi:carbon monoxide dehydrogenase subunit G
MSTVSRSFTVSAPPEVVVPYLADFANAEEWDPGTESCTRRDDGPVRVGAKWDNISVVGGHRTELTYTLESLSPRRIVLVGRNDSATSTETIDIVPDGGGSSISYTNELDLHGIAKLVAPITRVLMERMGDATEKRLVEVLDQTERPA